MRIRYIFKGEEKKFVSPLNSIVVGRPKQHVEIDFDLTPDSTVSRPHARITLEDDHYWIEDLGSRVGTFVDAVDIKGSGKVRLDETSGVRIGATSIFLEIPAGSKDATNFVANAKLSPILQPKEPATLAQIQVGETESPQPDPSVAAPRDVFAIPPYPTSRLRAARSAFSMSCC
jgi:pSer/pThr/pTyr-binding forkhead associated (FHA) protein